MSGKPLYQAKRQPMPWAIHAACRDVDTNVFYPERGKSPEPAKAICAECPVIAECLDHAIVTRELVGVWGGKSEHERRRLRFERRQRLEPGHGNSTAYGLHQRAGERPCDECRAWHAQRQREWRAS